MVNAQNHSKLAIFSHHKKLWIIGIIIFIFLILPILVVAWWGFVPGLSDLLGSKKARDLGVSYTSSDYKSYQDKAGISFKDSDFAPVDPTTNEKQLLGDVKQANNVVFTQEELTSAINNISWYWFPVKDTQVRLTDNTAEISGYLNSANLQNFSDYINDAGNTSNNVNSAVSWINTLAHDMPFYAMANVTLNNNVLNFKLTKFEVGRLDVPLGSLSSELQNGVDVKLSESKDFALSSGKINAGQLNLTGKYPTTIYVDQ